jgi:hypothetical protein
MSFESKIPPVKPIVCQLDKIFPAFYLIQQENKDYVQNEEVEG